MFSKYKNRESKLSTGQLALAQSIIAAFSPTTNIENNYKTFYTLQRAYLQNQDLTLLENIQLLLLAYQCPFTDGAIVYNARSLYGLINMVSLDYNDTYCAQLGFSFKPNTLDSVPISSIDNEILQTELIKHEKQSKEKYNVKNNYELFPNPAQDEVFVNSTLIANEIVNVKISDANGKVLLSREININNHLGKVQLNLINGVYVIEITSKTNSREFKKLVVSK